MPLVSENLFNNNRFYTLLFSFLASIFVICLLRLQDISDQLYYIQLEQVFGFMSLALLYATLIISPIRKIIGTPEWMKNVIFTRRALGVASVYFALLHAGVALWGELGGIDGLALLPDRFIWPLIYGTGALAILCALALISFDKVIIFLGYHRWEWLERLVYLCGILIILHVWLIGIHFTPGAIRDICLAALVILFGLEAWRIVDFLAKHWHWQKSLKYFFFLVLWVVSAVLLGWLAFSRPAEAHVLIKDVTGGKGTILHTTPNDDPIAGEQTSIVFDIQETSSAEGELTTSLTIADDQGHTTSVPARIQGNAVAAEYVFPRQGHYTLTLTILQGGSQIHQFTESQRVNRGVINSATTVRGTPLWAGVGVLGSVMAAIAVATIAFIRRKTINFYSKL